MRFSKQQVGLKPADVCRSGCNVSLCGYRTFK